MYMYVSEFPDSVYVPVTKNFSCNRLLMVQYRAVIKF